MDNHRLKRRLSLVGLAIGLAIGLMNGLANASSYSKLVNMLQSPNSAFQKEAIETLSNIINKDILKQDLGWVSDDTFLFGNFIARGTRDLAIGISYPPRQGNLVILTQKNGQYVAVRPITGLGYIESIEAVRLFREPYDQLVLNLVGGGMGLNHTGKDIYNWDGTAMRMIWAGVQREVWAREWRDGPPRGAYGIEIHSDITFKDVDGDGVKEIIASATIEEGMIGSLTEGLEKVLSRRNVTQIHRWDEALFFYVAEYGEIISPAVSVSCLTGISPQVEDSKSLKKGARVGILAPPGYYSSDEDYYTAVIGKECFCRIPKSAIRVLVERGSEQKVK
jgi:hypothetical protein